MKISQNRFLSKAAWTAALALILLVGDTFKLWDAIGITGDAAQAILNGGLALVAAFGIFNDPTNQSGF